METSTLPVGSGSLVDLIPSSASLATVAEPSNGPSGASVDFVVQTANAEVACEPTPAVAPEPARVFGDEQCSEPGLGQPGPDGGEIRPGQFGEQPLGHVGQECAVFAHQRSPNPRAIIPRKTSGVPPLNE